MASHITELGAMLLGDIEGNMPVAAQICGLEVDEIAAMQEVERAWFNPNRRRTGHTTRLVERAKELLDTATEDSPVVVVSQDYRNLDRIKRLIRPMNDRLIRFVATNDKEWRRVFIGLRSVQAVLVDNY